jgi:hypothetical protein
MALPPLEQLDRFKTVLTGRRLERDSPLLSAVTTFLRHLPVELTKQQTVEIRELICTTFQMTDDELTKP